MSMLIMPVNFRDRPLLPNTSVVTAKTLKRAIKTNRARVEQTKAGETAIFFRCFVYIMDRRLKTIIAIMTPRKYREKYDNFPGSQRVKRSFPPPGELSFEGIF